MGSYFVTAISTALLICQASNASAEQSYVKAMYSLPRTVDPINMNDTASLVVSNLIYDGLLRFTPDLEFEGAIASKWETLDGGRKYVFELRPGAKFHDGSPITADDVVASLSRAVSPQSTVYKYYDCVEGAGAYFKGRAKSVSGLRSENGKVVIILSYPFPAFLSVLAGATAKVLPHRLIQNAGFFEMPIGSGLFQVRKIDRSAKILTLERFNQYYGRKPKIKFMVLKEMTETEALSAAAQDNVHDLANFPLSGTEKIFKSGKSISSPVAATWIIGLNSSRVPFTDVRNRRAFRDSVDSTGFRLKFHPHASDAFGYVPKGLVGFQSVKKARPAYKVKPPKDLIKIAVPEILAREKEMREFIEVSLRSKGWNVRAVPMSWDKLMEGYNNKTLSAFLVSMNMDYPDPEFLIRNFESDNPDNFSGISDRLLDSLIRKSRQETDRIKRSALYQKSIDRLDDLALTVNLFHPRSNIWMRECVAGLTPNILADYYIDYRTVDVSQCSGAEL